MDDYHGINTCRKGIYSHWNIEQIEHIDHCIQLNVDEH